MAIDGVKIIDSDTACDIYNYVTESYKDGLSADKIIEKILADEKDYCIDDFYYRDVSLLSTQSVRNKKTTCYAGGKQWVIPKHLSRYNRIVQATIIKKGKVL